MIDALIEKVLRDFPEHQSTHYFEAALKLHHVKIVASMLEHHEVPVTGRYILRAVAAGVDTSAEIARILGLDEQDLAHSGAILIGANLLEFGPAVQGDNLRPLVLTREGHGFLKGERKVTVPTRQIHDLEFNPLTGAVSADVQGTLRPNQFRESGLPPILSKREPPTLGDLSRSAVREALDKNGDLESAELLDIISLGGSWIAYRTGIHVVVMKSIGKAEERLAAYRGFEYLPEESVVLNEMWSSGAQVLPQDAVELGVPAWKVDRVVSTNAARIIQDHLVNDQELYELRTVRSIDSEKPTFNHEAQMEELLERITELERENRSLETDLQSSEVTFLPTEDHRQWFERALREAESRVIVISPWMNRHAVDSQIVELIADAIARGVQVDIGYGIAPRNHEEKERFRWQTKPVIKELKRCTQDSDRLGIHNINGTHEKILICDTKFGITGSFNWLSYRGEINNYYRRETSTILNNFRDIERLIDVADEALRLAQMPT